MLGHWFWKMDFVSPIISPIVESLMLPLKKHLGFLVSSKNYAKDMDARMKQLKDMAQEVQHKWDTAVANTEVVPERVEPWLEDVKMMNERAQSIQIGGVGCFSVSNRYKAGKRSYHILKEIEELEKRESNIKFTSAKKSLAKNKMIESEQQTNVAYPSYLLHTCHHLQRLALTCDERVEEVVFEMDSPSSRQLATNRDSQPPLLLPYIEVIYLHRLKEMSHVWKCNWNKFLIPQQPPLQFPFQNLININLHSCHKLKYLFSPLMANFLSNLKQIKINDCNGIEEVISSRDDEEEENTTSSHQKTTLFPRLDTLELGYMPRLKSIGGGDTRCRSDKLSSNITNTIHDQFQSAQVIGACWSFNEYPTKIFVYSCDALPSLIPSYAVGQMKRLKELEIKTCKTMTEVFESESSTNNLDESAAIDTTLTSPTVKKHY
ncbi:hypothetical protein L1987_88069 [Smallanthus sonchifolius]|nr:hypothetical protein L1987_88069 [Smallanthus sonchifolius]